MRVYFKSNMCLSKDNNVAILQMNGRILGIQNAIDTSAISPEDGQLVLFQSGINGQLGMHMRDSANIFANRANVHIYRRPSSNRER